MKNGSHILGCISLNGESANPVWFDRKYRDELLSLEGDRGGKKVLNAHLNDCVMYEISDSREICDIDTCD